MILLQTTSYKNLILFCAVRSRQKLDGRPSFYQLFRPFISLISLKNWRPCIQTILFRVLSDNVIVQLIVLAVCYDLHH